MLNDMMLKVVAPIDLGATSLSMTLSIGITTFIIMTLSITALNLKGLFEPLSINGTQNNKTATTLSVVFFIAMLSNIMMSVIMLSVNMQCRYAESRYAECRGASKTV